MYWLYLLILFFQYSQTQNLILVANATQNSFLIDEIDIFNSEFPCISSNTSGVFRVLRFDIVIRNVGNDVEIRQDPISLQYNLTRFGFAVASGSIELACLRDSICTDMKYYSCTPNGISPGCFSRSPYYTECQWIDIRHLGAYSHNLSLVFENTTTELLIDFSELKNVATSRTEHIILTMSTMLWISLSIVFVPYLMHIYST